jgi:carboxylate-amine ligase
MDTIKFKPNERPTLGVELELQLVDSESMTLRRAITELLAALPADLRRAVGGR